MTPPSDIHRLREISRRISEYIDATRIDEYGNIPPDLMDKFMRSLQRISPRPGERDTWDDAVLSAYFRGDPLSLKIFWRDLDAAICTSAEEDKS